jgi:hypothetical protein
MLFNVEVPQHETFQMASPADDKYPTGEQLLLACDKRRQLILGSVELAKSMIADTKFLAFMKSKGALSESDYQQIDSEPINFKRNLQLIDVLLRGTDYTFNCLLDAVDGTDQGQVVKPILAGHFQSQYKKLNLATDVLKLALRRLPTYGDKFLRSVDPSGCLVMEFAAQLYHCGFQLDETTRQKLMSPVRTNYDKNSVLLDWLQKK